MIDSTGVTDSKEKYKWVVEKLKCQVIFYVKHKDHKGTMC